MPGHNLFFSSSWFNFVTFLEVEKIDWKEDDHFQIRQDRGEGKRCCVEFFPLFLILEDGKTGPAVHYIKPVSSGLDAFLAFLSHKIHQNMGMDAVNISTITGHVY